MHDVTCEFRAQYECAQTISKNVLKGTVSRLIYRVSKRMLGACYKPAMLYCNRTTTTVTTANLQKK